MVQGRQANRQSLGQGHWALVPTPPPASGGPGWRRPGELWLAPCWAPDLPLASALAQSRLGGSPSSARDLQGAHPTALAGTRWLARPLSPPP